MPMDSKSELSVITKSKDLCNYILTITDKSPKKFRFTLVSRLQKYSLAIIENLLSANEVRVLDVRNRVRSDRLEARRDYQQKAFTDMKLLSFMAQVSMEQQCILPKQYEQITKKLYDCQNLLGAWVKSDNKRYVEEKS
jgi:hypothetical protein